MDYTHILRSILAIEQTYMKFRIAGNAYNGRASVKLLDLDASLDKSQ